jgi:hypothetical protein
MDRASLFLRERFREVLMKRYAVEKVIGIKKLIRSFSFAILSFILFQVLWIVIAIHKLSVILQICLVIVVIFGLSFLWRNIWGVVGKFIPKFVWIGLLGWFFIAANVIPNLLVSGSWQLDKFDNGKVVDKNKSYGISVPATRLFGLNESEIDEADRSDISRILSDYIESFFVPYGIPCFKNKPGTDSEESRNFITSGSLRLVRYLLLLLAVVLFIDIFFTVSIYKQRYGDSMNRLFRVFSVHSKEREKNVKRKLILFSILLLSFSVLALNYFVLFWVLSFLTTIFVFRWEIKQRGQNHKPLSRAVLFVFLTQIFSVISGEILFLTLVPVYTFLHHQYVVFNIYDSIVLGWTILLGSSVTVLLGIVTQVIWSGRRMTESLKH